MQMRTLISGIHSGLGKHLHEQWKSIGLDRDNFEKVSSEVSHSGVDLIVHCAFNSAKEVSSETLYSYYNDNVLLTDRLLAIPHKKFVYISTVDLYPKADPKNAELKHSEENAIALAEPLAIYPTTKLLSESLVREKSKNFVIVRPTTLLGKHSRKNTLKKLAEDANPEVFLSADSVFNLVLHSDIAAFIELATQKDARGIFNLASSNNVLLSDLALGLGKKLKYGSHRYQVANVSNAKASQIYPELNRSSSDTFKLFLDSL